MSFLAAITALRLGVQQHFEHRINQPNLSKVSRVNSLIEINLT